MRVSPLQPSRYEGSTCEWTGEFRNIRGETYSVGKYVRYRGENGREIIHISELPLRVWTRSYIEYLYQLKAKHSFIERIDETMDSGKIDIDVVLSPDGLSKIAGCGDSIYTDDIEEFFKLRDCMRSHINLIGTNKEVLEFSRYEQVLLKWFPVRKNLYIRRIERQITVLEIKIEIKHKVIQYITANYTLRGMKRDDMDEFLSKEGYPRVYASPANDPEFIPTNEIRANVFSCEKASYKYLLDISDSGKSKERLDEHHKELKQMESELNSIIKQKNKDSFTGASVWLNELDQLEKVIREGFASGWMFGEHNMYTY
jgi:DNA gyrase/topoisomerase IV subunit A